MVRLYEILKAVLNVSFAVGIAQPGATELSDQKEKSKSTKACAIKEEIYKQKYLIQIIQKILQHHRYSNEYSQSVLSRPSFPFPFTEIYDHNS